MSLTTSLNGTYTYDELNAMKRPVAWSGTRDKGEAYADERELHALVDDALAQLEDAYLAQGRDNELAVKIEAGEITEIVTV